MQRKQVSEQLGIDIETLRFYEKMGLISKPQRLSNGYRQYAENHIVEIKVLKSLSLKPEQDCSMANQIIKKNLSLIEHKIKELKKLRTQLKTLLDSCLQTSTLANCKIVKSLNKAASGEDCVCHRKNDSYKKTK